MAGLISHCENSSVRCKINDGAEYAQVIDELSGGVIQANGYHEDGTVKYEAGQLKIQSTTTIGRTSHKRQW